MPYNIRKFQGLTIKIENPVGSIRQGKDRVSGKPWKTEMSCDYGEIVKTVGMDSDPVDVFIGKYPGAKFAFVIHQLNPNTGEFDEDKVFLGFLDSQQAKDCYFRHYDNPKLFFGDISAIPMAEFKQRLLKTPGKQIAAMAKLMSTVALNSCGDTPCGASANVGDQVVVDGLRGRGEIIRRQGKRVTVKFADGTTLSRDDRFVHPMDENTYRSRYSSLRAGEEMVEQEGGPVDRSRPGNMYIVKSGGLFCVRSRNKMDKDFGCYNSREEAVNAMSGRAFNGLTAGGPGSGRKPGDGEQDGEIPNAQYNEKYHAPWEDVSLEAGGQGSGCQGDNCGRPSKNGGQRTATLHKAVQTAIKGLDYKGTNAPNWVAQKEYRNHYQQKKAALENFVGHVRKLLGDTPEVSRANNHLELAKNNFAKTYIGMSHVRAGFASLDAALRMQSHANSQAPDPKRDIPDLRQKELFGASQYGETGWQYGQRKIARNTGFIPNKSLAGFPTAPTGGKRPSVRMPKVRMPGRGAHGPQFGKNPPTMHIKRTTPYPMKVPNAKPSVTRVPNHSSPSGSGFGVRKPNLSRHLEADSIPKLKGEGVTGAMGNAHIDPVVWFHPPSLSNRNSNESLRSPTDDPREKNNKFLDVTKRNSKDTKEQRMKILKRSSPGPMVPVQTTLLQHQTQGLGGMFAARKSKRTNGVARQFTSYDRRGVI